MNYSDPVYAGVFERRYKRFFADILLDGQKIEAHVANTGSLKSCLIEGAPCRVTFKNDPKRKLKYSLEQINTPNSWVGVNTGHANVLAWEAWEKRLFPHWSKYDDAKREVKISDETRLDLALFKNGQIRRYVEVKNVTYAENGVALFPDAETTRGQKHLRELMTLKEKGFDTELLFIVQRSDCEIFRAAYEIDPEYAKLLAEAHACGVVINAYAADLFVDRIELNVNRKLPVKYGL